MKYFKEWHPDSYYPVWFRLYGSGKTGENEITKTLLNRRFEIKIWIKTTRFKCVVDQKGYNYRFKSEKELTMFLLKWS